MNIGKVEWGKTSTVLLGLILASFVPVIQQWQETGVFPTGIAWQTAALAVVLGIGRYAQAIVDKVNGGSAVVIDVPVPDDEVPAEGDPA